MINANCKLDIIKAYSEREISKSCTFKVKYFIMILFILVFIVFSKINSILDDEDDEYDEYEDDSIENEPTPSVTPEPDPFLERFAKKVYKEFGGKDQYTPDDPLYFDQPKPFLLQNQRHKKLDMMVPDDKQSEISVMYPRFCCSCQFQKKIIRPNRHKRIKHHHSNLKRHQKAIKKRKRNH
ncbi:hypothetical protein TRFO_31798 [Tritrichomonas foetus]|uniref:Uncharacterized protein n=1 Tax=Tritrichomonas foetus TaxID=1144522 RepID=A0A1J4JQH6_9EUKA|nr:hypothetical protein TRFO_31798 [Tritrichomonas foetus]|eukprot:OHT01415.1 hypothetical protein TRFO_31798 [Tritrichomonas foetus]